MLRIVADMEEHAIRRDKRFILRLVLLLIVAVLIGVVLILGLTSAEVGGCVATEFDSPGAAAP